MSEKSVFIENATLDTTIAVKVDGDWRAAMVRKAKGEAGLYVLVTRKGAREMTARERITVADAGRAKDAVMCKHHQAFKQISNGGSLYCRDCVKGYMTKRAEDKKNGIERPVRTREERAKSKAEREEALRTKAAQERVDRLMLAAQQGQRRTEAFFLAAVEKYGESAARVDYSRYLDDDRMTALIDGAWAAKAPEAVAS